MTVGRDVANHAWPPERIAQLLTLWGKGYSAESIAAKMGGGLTRNAILGKIHRLRRKLGLDAVPNRVRDEHTPTRPTRSKKSKEQKAEPKPARSPRKGKTMTHPDTPAETQAETSLTEAANVLASTPWPDAIMALRAHHCRWPFGDPRHTSFRFCGAKAEPNRPYCAAHNRLAYNAVPSNVKRLKIA